MVEYYGKFDERNFPQALLVGADIYKSSVQNHFPILPKVKSKILITERTYTITITRKSLSKPKFLAILNKVLTNLLP